LAIGAVLIADQARAQAIVRLAKGEHFFDPAHGWLWDRMSYGLSRNTGTWGQHLAWWLYQDGSGRRCRELWQTSLLNLTRFGLEHAFWWHGKWYVGLVLENYRKRAKIVEAVRNLQRAIE
jgi:hypothetical protein